MVSFTFHLSLVAAAGRGKTREETRRRPFLLVLVSPRFGSLQLPTPEKNMLENGSATPSTSIPCTFTSSEPLSAMRLCYNGATTLLAATACPAAFVDLDSIREEPPSPRPLDRDDSVFFRESCSTIGSPLDELPALPTSSTSSPFKFMESIQRKRKSMFRRNQSSR